MNETLVLPIRAFEYEIVQQFPYMAVPIVLGFQIFDVIVNWELAMYLGIINVDFDRDMLFLLL